MFKPTHLYIKTHNQTGLKYFGKTIKNPMKYKGSGLHWLRHLELHGNDVTTEIVGLFTEEAECIATALKFSMDYNIVSSKQWANMKPENGMDGGLSSVLALKIKDVLLEKYGPDYYKDIARQSPNEKTKKKIGESVKRYSEEFGSPNLGKVRVQVECPHCGMLGAMNTMSRWHFDHCKYKL